MMRCAAKPHWGWKARWTADNTLLRLSEGFFLYLRRLGLPGALLRVSDGMHFTVLTGGGGACSSLRAEYISAAGGRLK